MTARTENQPFRINNPSADEFGKGVAALINTARSHPLNQLAILTADQLVQYSHSDTRLSEAIKIFDWTGAGWDMVSALHAAAPKQGYQSLLALENLFQALQQGGWELTQARSLIQLTLSCLGQQPQITLSATLVLSMALREIGLTHSEIENFMSHCCSDQAAAKDGQLFMATEQLLSDYLLEKGEGQACHLVRQLTEASRLASLSDVLLTLSRLLENNKEIDSSNILSGYAKSTDTWIPTVILPPSDMSVETAQRKAFIRKLVRNFRKTFRRDDSCALRLGADDSFGLDWLNQLPIYKGEARIEILPRPLQGLRNNLPGWSAAEQELVLTSTERLYSEYEKRLAPKKSVFELAGVNNVYDLDFIRERRLQHPGYRGSTALESFAYMEAAKNDGTHYASILDVGCGGGAFFGLIQAASVAHNGKKPIYTGLDFSRAQIARAKATFPTGHFLVEDAAKIPFEDATFDLVLANSVLTFIEAKRQIIALEEMLRVSRGDMLVSMTCQPDAKHAVPTELSFCFIPGTHTKTHHPRLQDVLDIVSTHEHLTVVKQTHYYLYMPNKEKWLEIGKDQFDLIGLEIDANKEVLLTAHENERALPFVAEEVVILPKKWAAYGDIKTMSLKLEETFKQLFGY